ncbi:MAG TPA: Calx-beta domain-containing protein, partial [Gemmata sp.]
MSLHNRSRQLSHPALRLEALEDRATPALIGLESNDVPVSVTGGADGNGDIAVKADGTGFVVTYKAPDASGSGVYFKRYDANWQLVQGPVAVNTVTLNNQQSPSIGVDAAGNFVIAWESYGQDPGDATGVSGIYARRFMADGTAVDSAEFRVNTTTANNQFQPDAAVNAAGQFVVTFSGGSFLAEDVFAQSYSGITVGASGNPTKVGGEAVVNNTSASTDDQTAPAVAIDASGNYVVAYQSYGQDNPGGGNFGIYARRMNQTGTTNGAEFLVNTVTAGNQQFPDIAMDGSGNFNIVWYSDGVDGSGTAIVMQRYNAAGAAQGGNTQVNTGITLNNQINPHISTTSNGKFLVTWTGEEADGDNIGTDVFYKVYNSAGTVLVGDTLVSPTTASNDAGEDNALGGINAAGDFVILFDSGASGNFDTYLRRYAEDADVSFSSASSNGSESSNASIALTRTGAAYVLANVATTVQVTRTGGTATPPGASQDFTTSFPTNITFPADGSTSKNLSITIVDDASNEPDEAIILGIGTVTGGSASGQTAHTYTINDNDPPPTLSVNSPSVSEGNAGTTTLAFTVTLSAASANTVTVNYSTANGTATTADGDYVTAAGSLTFAPGETSKTVNVTVNGDTTFEGDETLSLTLSSPANATIATGTGIGTITNDDAAPTLSINDPSVTETDAGTVNLTFTVTLSAASAQTTMVNYSTANNTATSGTDYVTTSGALTFAPGETSKTVTVTVNGDALFEGNETFFVNLTSPSNATIADGQGVGTITDNDAPASIAVVSGNNQSTVISTSFGSPLVVEVRNAGGALVQGVSVTFTAPGSGASAVFSTSTNMITANTDAAGTASSGAVTANGTDGGSYTVSAQAAGGTTPSTNFSLTNLPATSVSINDVTQTEGDSGTMSFTFTVTLSAASAQTVTVNYTTANGTATTADGDYASTSGVLTFAPGETSKTVTVLVNGDTTNEATETFAVNLSNPTNATIGTGAGTGTITNDDPVPSASIGDVTQAEGDSGSTSFTFTVTLSAVGGQTVTVNYTTADGTAVAGSDYASASGTLTFAAGETSKTVTVLVNGDTTNEATETFAVNLSNPTNATIGTGAGTGTITNDDP